MAKILIIDDNDDLRWMMSILLVQAGYTCIEARSAEDALSGLSGGPRPDAIVTDLHMTGMSGRELLAHLRAMPELSDVPVVLVSNDPYASKVARESGFDSYVDKPHLSSHLAVRLQHLLHRSSNDLLH